MTEPHRSDSAKNIVTARHAVAAVESAPAAFAARRVLEAGGNAIDAAAAASVASCVVEPELVDLGGYVTAAVVVDGRTGEVWSVDADSAAPGAASDSMFRVQPQPPGQRSLNENEYGCSVEGNANVNGALAVGVPATLAGIGYIQERWGKLPWAHVVAASQELLSDGFPVLSELATAVRARAAVLKSIPAAEAQFMPDGRPLEQGQTWHRPELEWTLQRLASAGWRDFYDGEIARKIVWTVRELGGILTLQDLQDYEVKCTPALSAILGDSRVYSAALPNGGLSSLSALLLLREVAASLIDDTMYWHSLAECLKIVWRDRLRDFGDPAYTGIDTAHYLSREYVERKTAMLRDNSRWLDFAVAPAAQPSPGTVHTSTADVDGNLVSITISHGAYFGSCVTVPGTGITLGHGMCRFDPRPGRPNSIAPGKRPLNNVCPFVLRQPGRDVAFGMRGGRRIVSVSTSLAYQLLRGHGTSDVLCAPRLHTDGYEPMEVSESMPAQIVEGLRRMGHTLKVAATVGASANAAERRRDGTLSAANRQIAAAI